MRKGVIFKLIYISETKDENKSKYWVVRKVRADVEEKLKRRKFKF